ncbi:16S rRNA (cytosine(1402)-N(4))-methyltransferase, partial [Candidatus Peregrinibacteria bacterium]|nr:16S rRNA (cytosine(1402)-N(4))-methyltransferase [Candidatus Peregrinibacteria bacterium]
MSQEFEHKSVLLNEVIDILKPAKGESLLDVTIGLGGHAKEVLSMTGSKGSLIALDADIQNLEEAQRR